VCLSDPGFFFFFFYITQGRNYIHHGKRTCEFLTCLHSPNYLVHEEICFFGISDCMHYAYPIAHSSNPNTKSTTHLLLLLLGILLERTQELSLLLEGLVCTVTEFGRGVDPFEVYLLQSLS